LKGTTVALVVVVVAILGLGSGFWAGVSNSHQLTTAFVTSTSSITTTSFSTEYGPVLNNEVFLMQVNGSFYWADDVSKDITIGMPGYSYFRNASVTFDGVKFQTICPPGYGGCPGSGSSFTTVLAGAIRFNMTFPDGRTETGGDVIGDSIYTFVISQHYPRAGMLIEYVNDYPKSPVDYAVFLLVSACCSPPYLK
jgi:hypothetical protein